MLLFKKYIIKETLLYFIVINLALFFISIVNTYIGLLTKMAGGKLSFNLAIKIILLYIPESLSLLVPVSLFIATLFVISKLYADNEIIVLFISGLSWRFLLSTVILLSVIVAIITAILTLYISPMAMQVRENLLHKGATLGPINFIIPGTFQAINADQQIFYVGEVNDNQIKDIFVVADSAQSKEPLVITAKLGQTEILEEQEGVFLVLKNGQRYSGTTENNNFSITNFVEYGRKLLPKKNQLSGKDHRLRTTKQILHSVDVGDIAELQWRIAMPISVLVLSMLAIGLAKVSPRQGRFAKFLPAILLYIIYFNAMILTRRLLAAGEIDSMYGIWIVHIGFLVLAVMLLLYSSGWLLYFIKKYFKYENYY